MILCISSYNTGGRYDLRSFIDGDTDCLMTVRLADGSCHFAEFSSNSAVNLELFKDACAEGFSPETRIEH